MRQLTCALLAACVASPALGDPPPTSELPPSPAEIANRDTLTLGLGGAIVPDYEGSRDYRIIPAAGIRGRLHGISFLTRGSYLYVDLLPGHGKITFDAGPIIGARLNNRSHVDDGLIKLLPKRKTTVEVGGFAGVTLHDLTNPYDGLAFRVDVVRGLGSGRGWTNVSPNVEFSTPLSRRTYVSANIGAEWVADRYAEYYFTISPSDSLRTGGVLRPFTANGGLKDWKASLMLDQSITGDLLHGFSVFGLAQYAHLVRDFERSPIVLQRGSAGQWIGALGLAYTW